MTPRAATDASARFPALLDAVARSAGAPLEYAGRTVAGRDVLGRDSAGARSLTPLPHGWMRLAVTTRA